MSRVHIKNWAVADDGDVVAAAAIEVTRLDSSSAVVLYAAKTGSTTKTNPFNAEADGSYEFWLEPGEYSVQVGGGPTQSTYPVYASDVRQPTMSRAEASAAYIGDNQADLIIVEDGFWLPFVRDDNGDAHTSADGQTWSPPLSFITPNHWARNTTPGTTNMRTAEQAAHDFAKASGARVRYLPQTYAADGYVMSFTEITGHQGYDRIDIQGDSTDFGTRLVTLPHNGSGARWTDVTGSDSSSYKPRLVVARAGASVRNLSLFDANSWSCGIFVAGVKAVTIQNVVVDGSNSPWTDKAVRLDGTWSDRNTTLKTLHPDVEPDGSINEITLNNCEIRGEGLGIMGTTRLKSSVASGDDWLWAYGGASDITVSDCRLRRLEIDGVLYNTAAAFQNIRIVSGSIRSSTEEYMVTLGAAHNIVFTGQYYEGSSANPTTLGKFDIDSTRTGDIVVRDFEAAYCNLSIDGTIQNPLQNGNADLANLFLMHKDGDMFLGDGVVLSNGTWRPVANEGRNLGTASYNWGRVRAAIFQYDDPDSTGNALQIDSGTGVNIVVDSTTVSFGTVVQTNVNIRPTANEGAALGGASYNWETVRTAMVQYDDPDASGNALEIDSDTGINLVSDTTTLSIGGTISANAPVVPLTNEGFSLGTTSLNWNNVRTHRVIYDDPDAGGEKLQFDCANGFEFDAGAVVVTIENSGVTIGKDLTLNDTSPLLRLVESDTASTHNVVNVTQSGGNFFIQTRQSDGTNVSTDYRIARDSGGATEHRWSIQDTPALTLTDTAATLSGGAIVADGGTINAEQSTIVHDAVAAFTFTNRRHGILILTEGADDDNFATASQVYMGYVDFGSSPSNNNVLTGADVVVDTATGTAPTGTTGTDGDLTIFLDGGTQGTLYVENRTGVTRVYNLVLL